MEDYRFIKGNRYEQKWEMVCVDDLVPPNHDARIVWRLVKGLKLKKLNRNIRAKGKVAGRPAHTPKVLLALWIYGTMEGVGSARALSELTQYHHAYRWLSKGLTVNYHTLSDFRSKYTEVLDELLTQSITGLIQSKVVDLESVLIDGTSLKANASHGSFKTRSEIQDIQETLSNHINYLKNELHDNPSGTQKRLLQRRQKISQKLDEKAESALAEMETVEEEKEVAKKKRSKTSKVLKASVSITDSDARIMRQKRGDISAGYNAQICVDPNSFMILGIDITNRRNDYGQASPMMDQLKRRYSQYPKQTIVDSGYISRSEIQKFQDLGVDLIGPIPTVKETVLPETHRKRKYLEKKESPSYTTWVEKMAQSKPLMKLRKRVETVYGNLHNHGLRNLSLRGLSKVRSELLLHALAHNFRRQISLGLA